MDSPSRTILNFIFSGESKPIIEKWADENFFNVRSGDDGGIECQRGGGVMMCPIMVRLTQTGESVHLETWLEVDLLTQLTTLFMAPTQSTIDSSSTRLWREKEIARISVNKLLHEFGQPPIK